jgi:hypothetical protein
MGAQSPRAGCLVNPGVIQNNGVATRELRVRAGQPCHLNLLNYFGYRITVNAAHITVPPAHGTLRTSTTTGGRGIVTYTPARGFIGHDRFEVIYQWTILRLAPEEIQQIRPSLLAAYEVHLSAEYKAEATVTP